MEASVSTSVSISQHIPIGPVPPPYISDDPSRMSQPECRFHHPPLRVGVHASSTARGGDACSGVLRLGRQGRPRWGYVREYA